MRGHYKRGIMRGLIFTGGKSPDMACAAHLFGSPDIVIAADSGLYAAERAKIVPDLIIGDMDSIVDASILAHYPGSIVQRWPRDKDYTDTELALSIMKDRDVDDIVLVGGCGGRLDHLFAIKALYEGDDFPSLWIGEESVVIAVGDGVSSWGVRVSSLGPDDPVSVFPVGGKPFMCSSRGFYWPVDELDWASGRYSLSNRCPAGSFEFSSISGRFIIVVPLSPGIAIARFSRDSGGL
jgi:thiamine pyrophosphokinase